MGDKYSLRCRINSARDRIGSLEGEISKLHKDIEHLEFMYNVKCKQQSNMNSLFERKRAKNAEMRGLVRGVAATSVVQLYEEEYSYAKSNALSDNYEQLKYYIKCNIKKLGDDIETKNSEISSLESSISRMEQEIRDIEAEEEREKLNEQLTK